MIAIGGGGATAAMRTALDVDRYRCVAVVLPLLPSLPPCRHHAAASLSRNVILLV
jgi:hypothetical protein